MKAPKTSPEVAVQMVTNVTATDQSTPCPEQAEVSQRNELFHVILRLLCLLTTTTALSLMVTAKESGSISIYGFSIPLYAEWSFSDSFIYQVAVCGAVAVHSLLQLLISALRVLQRSPAAIHSHYNAWLIFAVDQIFAYALISAGSAASGVTNLNRTGIHRSALPNFCNPLRYFCDHVAVSIALTFFSCFLLGISIVLNVIWLSKF